MSVTDAVTNLPNGWTWTPSPTNLAGEWLHNPANSLRGMVAEDGYGGWDSWVRLPGWHKSGEHLTRADARRQVEAVVFMVNGEAN